MTPSYQRWTVRGYMRPVIEWTSEGEPFGAGYSEPVVVVFDPRGWEWHVTTAGGEIASLNIVGKVDQAALRSVPLGYLREVAVSYAAHIERASKDGIPLSVALAEAAQDPGEVRMAQDSPSLTEFAEAWHSTPTADHLPNGQRITRRNALAQRWNVSPYTVDDWTKRARAQGLIPPATTGRGNKTPGSHQPPDNRK